MNYIEKMVKEMCPNGVEYKPLGEVCDFKRGQSLTSKNANPGEVPVISGGQKPAFMHNVSNRLGETIVIAGSGAYAGYVSYWNMPIFVSDAFSVDVKDISKVSTRYVYHYLLNNQQKIYSTKSGAGIPHVYGKNIAKFSIPLPPLKIQEEIVKILDKFTKYVTELTAELTQRRKQYTYYRDKLLSFENEVYQVEWKSIDEIATFRRGSFPQPYTDSSFYGGENAQPFVQVADVSDDGFMLNQTTKNTISQKAIPKSIFVPKNTVIVTLQGTIGRVAVTQYDAYVDRTLAIFDSYKIEIDKKYFAYQLKNVFDKEKEFARGSTLKTITKEEFSRFMLPIPSVAVQKKIVYALDNFDKVCNDLNVGLPKEIELRQKQYEYFREKLLTFIATGVHTENRIEWNGTIVLLQWIFGTIRVELGTVCDIVRGNGLQKSNFVDTGVPCIHYGQIYTHYGLSATKTKSFVSLETANKLKKASYNDVIVATTSENIEDVGKSLVWLSKEQVCIGGHSCILKTNFCGKYFVYYMQTDMFQRHKERLVVGTKVIELYPKNLSKAIVVLPPLHKQQQIVDKLDRFDTLTNDTTNGLQKEIELRQKEYEYWRDKLLSF